MGEVAIAWVARRLGVLSVLVGASRPERLVENIASLDVVIAPHQQAWLDAASRPPMIDPYFIFELQRERIFGGRTVQPWPGAAG